MTRQAGAVLGALFLAHAAAAQFIQQGPKLVGSDAAVGWAQQGYSVAISAEGSTAVVGGPGDNSGTGAAWVYTRSGGVWTQQGSKLVGTGAVGAAAHGCSVAISADGNTAIVGGDSDNPVGATWVYTRSGGLWSQQGAKLVGTGAVGFSAQGHSVAISADGNTAIVGGHLDNSAVGAAWVFKRSGGVWRQMGNKLVGNGAAGHAFQGSSVAISGDGNTAIVGGPFDNSRSVNWVLEAVGAAWVFTCNGGLWSQQGSKLVGTGAAGLASQGYSVAISADGSTAIVGGRDDNCSGDSMICPGAAWVFTRSGGVWSQQGSKLIGTGAPDPPRWGSSVAISGDGNTAIVGGPADNFTHPPVDFGAAWIFTRAGGAWSQQGSKLVGSGAVGATEQGLSVVISADGNTAIVGGPDDNCSQGCTGAAWVFFAGGCAAPSIAGQPQSESIESGQTATLSVAAMGTAPLAYQWYLGALDDTSQPVGTNASSFTTPVLTASASYWVRVSNACGHADSATATITIGNALRRHLRRAT
ncbi:MAG: hypothetical protein ACHP7P_13815 [Terriglobales bacterium]